uniref:Uncharacterized protein n=1 Tax=Solanum tuberosum TaxID=4113 RepID=M1DX49_SOLTU
MAECFDFTDAQKLFQQDDARRLHHLAMLQGRDLHLIDNGKLSNSWNEYIISLHSGYVTLRHDSNFIVESYSSIRFSRQFGFCQDVPGDLMEHPYDDTIVIDDNDFVDEDSNSASLFELAKQLDLQELYGGDLNNDAVADFTVDLNDLDAAAEDFHSSINDDQPSLEVVPPRKSPSNDVMPSLEVVPPRAIAT